MEQAHALEQEEGFEEVADDEDFAPVEEADVFESDFEETDEEEASIEAVGADGAPLDAEAREQADVARNEAALRREEKQANRAEKKKRFFDPLAASKGRSAPSTETRERRVSFATTDASSAVDETKIVERRQAMRASTLANKQQIDERLEEEAAKRASLSTSSTRSYRKEKTMTQADYIAAAFEEEDKNRALLRDWLVKEEERQRLARQERKQIEGPRVTWISRQVVTQEEDEDEERLVKIVNRKFKLDKDADGQKIIPVRPPVYERNIVFFHELDDAGSRRAFMGDHVDPDAPIVKPQRRKNGLRKPTTCPFTGEVAKYRYPGVMIPCCKLECYRKITQALERGLVWNEQEGVFEDKKRKKEPVVESSKRSKVKAVPQKASKRQEEAVTDDKASHGIHDQDQSLEAATAPIATEIGRKVETMTLAGDQDRSAPPALDNPDGDPDVVMEPIASVAAEVKSASASSALKSRTDQKAPPILENAQPILDSTNDEASDVHLDAPEAAEGTPSAAAIAPNAEMVDEASAISQKAPARSTAESADMSYPGGIEENAPAQSQKDRRVAASPSDFVLSKGMKASMPDGNVSADNATARATPALRERQGSPSSAIQNLAVAHGTSPAEERSEQRPYPAQPKVDMFEADVSQERSMPKSATQHAPSISTSSSNDVVTQTIDVPPRSITTSGALLSASSSDELGLKDGDYVS